jgi:predicted enzyme related to lactoylglutathione lyase
MTTAIAVQGIYACLAASDFDQSLAFYTTLMGRAPDEQPFPGMAQWRNMNGAGLQLWHEPENAGHNRTTIVVPVMAAERRRLEGAGVAVGPDVTGEWGVIVQVVDPDGNQVTLAEPPKDLVGN